jgi:hypothetical protein
MRPRFSTVVAAVRPIRTPAIVETTQVTPKAAIHAPAQHRPALDQDHLHAEIRAAKCGRVSTRPGAYDDELCSMRRVPGRCSRSLGCLRRSECIFRIDDDGLDVVIPLGFRCAQRRNEVARRHLVTDGNVQLDDSAGLRCGHIHRGLVRFQRDDGVFDFQGIAGCCQHLDHLDLFEVPEVRDSQFDTGAHQGMACSNASTSDKAWLRKVVNRTA